MSVSNLTARKVAVGQSASVVVFRRVCAPVACAANDRSERLQRPTLASRPSLRDAPKLKSGVVATRLEPSPVELESIQETTPIEEEEPETEGSVRVLPTKTYHFGPKPKTETPPAATQTEIEEVDTEVEDNLEQLPEKPAEHEGKPDVLVVKRPPPVQASSRSGVRGAPSMKGRMTGPLLGRSQLSGNTERPKVIVAKRPVPKPREPVKEAPMAVSKERVDNVLVVKKVPSDPTPAPRSAEPSPSGPVPNGGGRIEKPPVPIVEKPVQLQERGQPLVAKAANVIERPRPKASPRPVPPSKPAMKASRSVGPLRANRPSVLEMKRPRNVLRTETPAELETSQLESAAVAESPAQQVEDVPLEEEPQEQSAGTDEDMQIQASLLETADGLQEEKASEDEKPGTDLAEEADAMQDAASEKETGAQSIAQQSPLLEKPVTKPSLMPSPVSKPVLKLNKPMAPVESAEPLSVSNLSGSTPLDDPAVPEQLDLEDVAVQDEPVVEDPPADEEPALEETVAEEVPLVPEEQAVLEEDASLKDRATQIRASLIETAHRLHEEELVQEVSKGEVMAEPAESEDPSEQPIGDQQDEIEEGSMATARLKPAPSPKPALNLKKPSAPVEPEQPVPETEMPDSRSSRLDSALVEPHVEEQIEVEDASVQDEAVAEEILTEEVPVAEETEASAEVPVTEKAAQSEADAAEIEQAMQIRAAILETAHLLHEQDAVEEEEEETEPDEEASDEATASVVEQSPVLEKPVASPPLRPPPLSKPVLKVKKPAAPVRPSRPSVVEIRSRKPMTKSEPSASRSESVGFDFDLGPPAPSQDDDEARIPELLSSLSGSAPAVESALQEQAEVEREPVMQDTTAAEAPILEDASTVTEEAESPKEDPAEIEEGMQIRASLLETAHRLHELAEEKQDTQSREGTPPRASVVPPKLAAPPAPQPTAPGEPTDAPDNGQPHLMKPPSRKELSKDMRLQLDRRFFEEKAEKAKEIQERARLAAMERRALAKAKQQEKLTARFEKKRSDPMLLESRRKARQERQTRRRDATTEAEREMIIEVGPEGLSVEDLAGILATDPTEVIKTLFMKGVMVTVNQTLDLDSVRVVAAEMGVDVVDRDAEAVTEMAKKEESFCEDDDENAINRSPVVTVMGHVDHGKTSLLDYIRRSQVVAGEAGGITQAIGAYTCSVQVEGQDRMICFLDTPGHEAFGAMRARGTRVTDVAVIVIAANDGVRPQTLEAISHARAAEVPMVVAINKIDVEGADPERVKRELSEIELLPEEWGGKTPVVEISAKTGTGVQELLEMLTLVADVQLDLRANPDVPARGTVIEAFVKKRSGVIATLLVQNGTLHVGDALVAGGAFGRVRSLTNELNDQVDSAGPSIAVQMLGFHEIPAAGDVFSVCADEAEAKAEAEKAAEEIRLKHLSEASGGGSMVTLSSLASIDDEDSNALQRLNLVLKADTSGSLEAVKGALAKLPQEAVVIRYLHTATGEVTESDVLLAAAAEGRIVCFNTPTSDAIKAVGKQRGVEMQNYSVIYDLIDDVRAVMEGRLSPVEDRLPIGQAEVRAVFGAGSRRVAGCMVTEGRLEKDCHIRVLRKKSCIYEGPITSLRRIKDDVAEVAAGLECGVGCDDYSEWQEGDLIEAFTLVEKHITLEESHAKMAVDQTELQELMQ